MKGMTFAIIIGVCVLVLVLAIVFKKVEWLINFVFRALLGVVLLYCINSVLANFGVTKVPGINGINVASVGLFGMPGIFLLYAVMIYYSVSR